MSHRLIALGIAALVGAAPVAAQQRGTLELGVFGGATSYGSGLLINDGAGAGVRIGAFLDPRWAVEFDGSGMNASRPSGFSNISVTSLAARLTLTPLVVGRTSWVVGVGPVQTDYGTQSAYGVSGLVGAKLALGPTVALRVDGTADFMSHRNDNNYGFRAGVSFFRQPSRRVVTVASPPAPMAVMAMHHDSVSATEQRRLRLIEANYAALRDSLARPVLDRPVALSSATSLATMREMIHFATDSSILTDSAMATLNDKVVIFEANPEMRIVIIGNTDERATDEYNMALGSRRADAAKAYLVSKGVDPVRIELTSRGESRPIAAGTTTEAQGQNRRAEFRLLVASDYLLPPRM